MESERKKISNEDCIEIDIDRMNAIRMEGTVRMENMKPFLNELAYKFNHEQQNGVN